MKIKISEAYDLSVIALKAGLVPMIHGSPAVGKSAMARRIAKTFGLKLIDMRLAQCDPVDLNGFPKIGETKAGYLPMETFPIEGDRVPEGYNGWLLFLDELNSAPPSVQAAAYKLILDRMTGVHHLHKKVAIMAAGNLETDGAIVQPMSTALQSRMVHLQVEVDHRQWLNHANEEGYDSRITSYVEFMPDHVYTFSADHTDKTYASPRTWEFMDKILKVVAKVERGHLPLFAGTIGEGVARSFYGFCQNHDKMPKIAQIEANPNTIPVPDEPAIQYALTGAMAAHVSKENADALLDFTKRLPGEIQIVAVRSMVKRNRELLKYPGFSPWVHKLAQELM